LTETFQNEENIQLKNIKRYTDELSRVGIQIYEKQQMLDNNSAKISQLKLKIDRAREKHDKMLAE
jgi:hypothetical protein